MARVSPRIQPAKSALTSEAVLQAGMRVLRKRGIEGVTMRAVAAELETGAASLYVYVANRQDLLSQMFDRVVGEIDVGDPPDSGRWREQVAGLMRRALEVMEAYPGIARIPLANVPTGPNAMRVSDHLVALLRAGGVDDRSIGWFVDAVFLFVNATAFEAAIYAEAGTTEASAEDIRVAFARHDPAAYPNLFSMLRHLTEGDRDARFSWGIQLMIDGLLHTPHPNPGS
jgi:AcrR family transcriptional regulator